MKLLINTELTYSVTFNPSVSEDDWDEYSDYFYCIQEVLDKYNVSSDLNMMASGASIWIEAQKITLDDIAMNHLFSDVLYELFSFKLDYAWLGGEGCEFSMRLLDVVPCVWID